MPSDREIEAATKALIANCAGMPGKWYPVVAEVVLAAAATARPDFTVDELRAIKTALADTWRVDPSQSRNVADTAYAKVLASLGEGSGEAGDA